MTETREPRIGDQAVITFGRFTGQRGTIDWIGTLGLYGITIDGRLLGFDRSWFEVVENGEELT